MYFIKGGERKNATNPFTMAFRWMIIMIGVIFKIILLFFGIKFETNDSNAYGSADTMSYFRRSKIISGKNDGLLIETNKRISEEKSFKHVLVSAGTGWGKSTQYVIPNLLNPPASMPSFVVTDPSGELWNNTSGYLDSIGYTVKKLDFSNRGATYGFNALAHITDERQVERIADVLIRSSYSDKGDKAFWNDMGREVLSIFMKCLLHPSINDRYRNLGNVRYLLNAFGYDGSPLNTFFMTTCSPFLLNEVKGFIAQDEKVRQGAISTAKGALRLFSNLDVCSITSDNSINLEDVRDMPMALYVSIPEKEEELFQPLLNVFYTELFYFLMDEPLPNQKAVYTLLDEGGNLTIPSFAKLISTLRKRRVSVSLIIQSLSQIEAKYGRADSITILDNLKNQIYAPGMNLDTAKKLEALLGEKAVVVSPPSAGYYWETEDPKSKKYIARSLYTADEIRRLDSPLFLTENERATLLKGMLPYFRDSELSKRAAIHAPIVGFPVLRDCEFLMV